MGFVYGWLLINWEALFYTVLGLGVVGAVFLVGVVVMLAARWCRRSGRRVDALLAPGVDERLIDVPLYALGKAAVADKAELEAAQ